VKKFIAAAATAAAIVSVPIATAPEAAAYPSCYYAYGGCYLPPGWYGGRWWYGGPWWGWGSLTDSIQSRIPGCPVPFAPDGTCLGA